MMTASMAVVLSRVSSNVMVGLRWGMSVGLPVGVAESSLIADGDQGDDDEGAAHGWSPLRC